MTTSHHGIVIPLASLRSEKDSGIGEYLDLIPIIDWCSRIGFDIIQLLPINDSGDNPSPYSTLSATALNPIYLSLWALPFLEKIPNAKQELEKMAVLNTTERFDYKKVLDQKEHFLRRYYQAVFPEIRKQDSFQYFLQTQDWVDEYATFKCLKTINQEKPWWQWTSDDFVDEASLDYYRMVQYLAFSQLKEVRNYADQRAIQLKGDIPILISRDSADVWAHQSLFLFNYIAGAPPDMYNEEGQHWGFPLYNWINHEKTDFAWWKERLKVAENFYHLYRLDHIIGFYRIWAIPLDQSAKNGFFLPHNSRDWIFQGEKILQILLTATKMHPIGEDLGVIPPEVRTSLTHLGIPGTKIYRWERRWDQDGGYIPIEYYPVLSMTSISTHDSETLTQWWQKDGEEVQRLCQMKGWEYTPELSSERRLALLQDTHNSRSTYHINLLQEYLALFPELSWPNPDQDRINVPGTQSLTNWTSRFRPFITEIVSHPALTTTMQSLSKSPSTVI